MQYDVAIIGGGLAGLSLAIQCANTGYSVVLFEKESYPFHKVCGEYISMESWNHLQQLGLPLQEWNLPIIKHLTLSDAKGKLYNFDLPLGGFGISRYKLDEALYKIALENGVNVLTETKVNDIVFNDDAFTVQSTKGMFKAKVAAGSFGKRSNLDVKWNRSFVREKPDKLNNFIGVKYHIRYPYNRNEIALHNFNNGYCGLSKIEDDKSCLCYLTTANNLKSSGNSIEQMEKEILFRNPQLKKIFAEAEFLYDQPLTISQISFQNKSHIENHVFLLGDAAGMITPLCGNGMSMALHGSKIAFKHLHAFLEGTMERNKMERAYEKAWNKQFKFRLQVGRMVQRLFGNDTTTSLFLKLMKAMPSLAKMVIKSTHGKPF